MNASRIGSKGGLYTFTAALIECLRDVCPKIEVALPEGISVAGQASVLQVPGWLAGSSRVSKLRPILWFLYSAFFFPVRRGRRILSTTHQVLPFRRNQIVTVHDLRPLREPDSWVQHFYFRYLLPRALRQCDGILTVSETSKRELIDVYGLPERVIHVVPNAIRPHASEARSAGNAIADGSPFLLVVGASWRHKNAHELLEQHALWADRYRLKLVAGKGQYLDSLRRRAEELQIAGRVEFIDQISDEDLQRLYMGCSAFVYPSRIEGFGIPPLEAMAHGKPVVVSDIPVFRELFADVPLYVQLGSRESWAMAFEALAQTEADDEDWRRDAGRRLAGSYSIERMRTALVAALKEIWK